MVKLSDHDIDVIIQCVESSFRVAANIRTRAQQILYVTDFLKMPLKNKQSGLRENVCNRCLGTGYNPENTIV